MIAHRPWGVIPHGRFFCFFFCKLKVGLALFRLNEYNIFGLVYASIVIMRWRK